MLARQLSTSMLIDAGYEVDATQDGGIAWDALQFRKYDLVITDNRLPKMSGIELLKKLRGAGMTLPVILATGVAPKEEFPRKPSIQPDATLVKPYSLADFLETVKRVLCGAEPVVAQRAAT